MTDRESGPPPAPESISRLWEASGVLRDLDDGAVIQGLSRTMLSWREEKLDVRLASKAAESTGASPEMIRFGLHRLLESHREESLRQWLSEARVEAARRLAGQDPRGESPELNRLTGPPVIAQVLAGNITGLGIPATLEALLARSAVVLKPAEGDPWTARLFKESLDRTAPVLGDAVAVEEWKGGAGGIEDRILATVDFVVATGGQEMVSSLASRLGTPHRFYGPRFSLGVVGMDWMNAPPTWWDDVVRECVLWDQAGCLSPRILFVGGNPQRFARRLAESMARWQERWPARPWSAAEASDIHGFRAPYEMAEPDSAGVLHPGDASWTVVWDQHPTLDVGPPTRVIRVTPRLGVREFGDLLMENEDSIQGMGTAFLSHREVGWKRAAGWSDIPRICDLTEIQDPPAGWRADGRSGLSELLTWKQP